MEDKRCWSWTDLFFGSAVHAAFAARVQNPNGYPPLGPGWSQLIPFLSFRWKVIKPKQGWKAKVMLDAGIRQYLVIMSSSHIEQTRDWIRAGPSHLNSSVGWASDQRFECCPAWNISLISCAVMRCKSFGVFSVTPLVFLIFLISNIYELPVIAIDQKYRDLASKKVTNSTYIQR